MMHRIAGALTLVSVLSVNSARADAPPSSVAYDTEADLPSEGIRHLVSAAILGTYARTADGPLRDTGELALRNRFFLGRTLGYVAGLDADVGGSNAGFAYGGTAYILGIGLRWRGESTITLSGGGGYDRVGDALPGAAKVPAELAVALALGPIRPTVFARPAWILGSSSRRDGAGISVADEIDAGLLVRLSRQHRYWGDVTAGGGLAVGLSYRRVMDTSSIGAMIGFELEGGR